MIEQLKTIRAGLETATCYSMLGVDAHSVQIAITALSELEAMAGEPVAWVDPVFLSEVQADGGAMFVTLLKDEAQGLVSLYRAAPVAQQPQADSLESLLSTAIGLLMGYEDRDGKGGTRNPYKPGSAVANFVAECVERLKDWPMTDSTQQPQAGAVSDDLRDRLVAISQAIADQDDRAAQAMIREILAAPQQAVLAKRVPMTDEQIHSVYLENMLYQDGLTPSGMVRVTRAIERAQAVIAKGGIVGEKGGA